ncbi:MAG: polysaccharide lyase family 8 super-sandwich domain-containing protein [Bacteroidales bacterium]
MLRFLSLLLILFLLPPTIEAQENWSEKLNAKFIYWLNGDTEKPNDSLVKARMMYWQQEVALAHKYLGDLDLKDYTPYNLDSTKKEQEELRGIFRNILYQLVSSYYIRDWPDKPNPDYKSTILADSIVMLFDYFNAKGWGGDVSRYVVRDSTNFSRNGFLPLGGTMGNNFGGYAISVLRFKEVLKARGIFEREMETLNYATYYLNSSSYHKGYDFPGFNADGIRSFICNRLWYLLALDDLTSFDKELKFLKWFLEKGLTIAPGLADMIKPDHSGFHHKHIYMNAYTPGANMGATIAAWMLYDSPYAIDPSKVDNLIKAILTQRLFAQKYDVSPSVGGRFPYKLNAVIAGIPSMILLSEMSLKYREMLLKAASRLLKPADTVVLDKLVRDAIPISFLPTGLLDVQNIWSMYKGNLIEPEDAPQGYWFFPYGGASIFRDKDWMITFKGQSRYIIDYESSSYQNVYGKNLSAGSSFLFAKGKPVSAQESGFTEKGYDWNLIPGTTSLYYDTASFPIGKFPIHFASTSFNGGVIVDKFGLSALEYEDIHSSLKAKKSVFFVGSMVFYMGSNIYAPQDTNRIQTTIYQIGKTDDLTEKAILKLNRNKQRSLRLMDPQGNAYFFPKDVGLVVKQGNQIFPNSSTRIADTGYFYISYLNHGRNLTAEKPSSYQYVMIPQDDQNLIDDIAETPDDYFHVVRQDSLIHAVYFPQISCLMAAFYYPDTLKYGGRKYYPEEPCLLSIREGDEAGIVYVYVQNPDLGWYPEGLPKDTLYIDPKYLYSYSPLQKWDLYISGNCRPDCEIDYDLNKDKGIFFHLKTHDARSIRFKLKCTPGSLPESSDFNNFDLKKLGPFEVYDIQGRKLMEVNFDELNKLKLLQGVYVIRSKNEKYRNFTIKIYQ